MKLRKLLSTFLSVAMLSTLVSAFSVAHAEAEFSLEANAIYNSSKDRIEVTVSYKDFAGEEFNEDEYSVKGIQAISFEVIPTNSALAYKGGAKGTAGVGSASLPATGKATFAFNAGDVSEFLTASENSLATFRFQAADGTTKDVVSDFEIKAVVARTAEWADFEEVGVTDYVDNIPVTNATYGEVAPPAVPSVDVANEVIVKAAASNPEEANTVGIKATATPVNGGTFTKLTANLNNGSKDASVVVYEGTAIDAVTVFGLNIMQVPAGVTITVANIVAE